MADIAFAAVNDHETPLRELRGDERAAVVIHLDAADLPAEDGPVRSRERTQSTRSAERTEHQRSAERTPRPYARIADGPGLPDRVIKRLLCSGRIRTVIHEHGNVRDLGRSHRVVTDRLFRALLIRDHGRCAHPGCDTTRSLQAHHIRQWLHGGRTDLHNLLLLCQAHHLAHHDGEYTITGPQFTGMRCFMGRTVVLDTGTALVVISERNQEPWDRGVFESVGIDPARQRYLLLKSRMYFRPVFLPIAKGMVFCDAPGVSSSDWTEFEYRKLRRPIYPLDENFAGGRQSATA